MKLRIEVEGRPYEVDVDVLNHASPAAGPKLVAKHIPESVTRSRPPHKLPEDSVCRSPIAGRVVAVLAAPGQKLRRNEPVVMIEAMKMEVPIGPAVDGTLKAVHVEEGAPVAARQVLFELA